QRRLARTHAASAEGLPTRNFRTDGRPGGCPGTPPHFSGRKNGGEIARGSRESAGGLSCRAPDAPGIAQPATAPISLARKGRGSRHGAQSIYPVRRGLRFAEHAFRIAGGEPEV